MQSEIPGIISARYLRSVARIVAIPLFGITGLVGGFAIAQGQLMSIPVILYLLLFLGVAIIIPAIVIVFASIGENIAHIRIALEIALEKETNAQPAPLQNDRPAPPAVKKRPPAAPDPRNDGWLRPPGR